jgi:polyisoprenoid-binding protein YceI
VVGVICVAAQARSILTNGQGFEINQKESVMRRAFRLLAVVVLVAGCEAQPVPMPAPAPVVTATPVSPEASTTTDTGEPAADPFAATSTGDTQPALAESTAEVGGPSLVDPNAAPAGGEAVAALPAAEVAAKPVAATDGVVTLSPENTKIQFEGFHSPRKPADPHIGGFAKFSGQAVVDADKLKSVSVEIDTASLFTKIPKLTGHLKTADFFEVREYPTAKFESTKVAPGEGGQTLITGNLTLHGVTKEIAIPATVAVTASGLVLTARYDLDRTEFGMTYGGVEEKVPLTVVVGEKTAAP